MMIKHNNKGIPTTIFPDNTSQVWKLPEAMLKGPKVDIEWSFAHESEFMQLAQLKSLLDHHQVKATLTLSYLPYGRQDKEVDNDATFALVTFADLLNHLQFEKVIILDPHSVRALDLIHHAVAQYPTEAVARIFAETSDLICYPDNGARSKYTSVYPDWPSIWGEKVRDQATGFITSYKLVGDPKGKKVLIIDDICDGGQTFRLLAKDLIAAGATQVVLFVTHGIFSKGTRGLFDSGISRVFTKSGEIGKRFNDMQF